MEKISLISLFIVSFIFLYGCGKNPVLTTLKDVNTGNSGVKVNVEGVLKALKGNISFLSGSKATAYQAPSKYSIVVSSVKLLKSVDDSSGYVIFDKGSFDNAVEIDLAVGVEKEFGANTSYPSGGTYNFLEYKLLYIKQIVTYWSYAGQNPFWNYTGGHDALYKAYASTYGDFHALDIATYMDPITNGVWKWLDTDAGDQLVSSRPSNPRKVDWDYTVGWKENNTYYVAQQDPAIIRVPLSTPLVIPESPTGIYVIKVSFNINNKFRWMDNYADGKFGDGDYGSEGNPKVNPMPPEVTVTFTKQ